MVTLMNADVFELRIYHTHPGRLDALNARFRNHTTRIFERHGMVNVGYWTTQSGQERDNQLVYILRHKSRDAAKASWDAFRQDPEWVKARAESEKDGPIVQKVESIFLDAVDYSRIK